VDWYPWLVFAHIVGAFLFALSHGASAWTAEKIKRERDRTRIAALLDLSAFSMSGLYVGLLLLLAGGIGAGIVGSWFRQGWIWLSLGILVVVVAVMYVIASPYYGGLRTALGQEYRGKSAPPVSDAELATMLTTRVPDILALVGFLGILAILFLMVLKPF
jgi:uncharacterized membrane protein